MQEVEEAKVPSLFDLSVQAALSGDYWLVQRRQLAYLPEEGANALLASLLRQRRLGAPQLELFRYSAGVVEVDGSLIPGVGANWLAYLRQFRALHVLRLLRCLRLRDAHLDLLVPLAPTLRVLSLARCAGLTAGCAPALGQLTALESLDLADTHMGPPTARCLSHLTSLTSLCLGGLPTSDDCCIALARLSRLRRLVLWGSEVGDQGMRELEHLSRLTTLDLSLTHCHSPPLIPRLCHLSMVHCQLDVEGEDREALWLEMGATLPSLEELDLQFATLSQPHGAQLLRQLAGGAGAALRTLRLASCSVADLSFLEGAEGVTYLDLRGTAVHDALLGSLALLPLRHLSLADTGVTDHGLGQLLAMTSLTHLDLRNTLVGDGSLALLAQLPQLRSLDLSGTEFAGDVSPADVPRLPLRALTSLSLLQASRLDDRGCKLLAKAAPALRALRLGSSAVTDSGIRALSKLPSLTSLAVEGCQVSDHGLGALAALQGSLRELQLDNCWLLSEEGLSALLDSLPGVEAASLNGVALRGAASEEAESSGRAPSKTTPGGRQRGRASPAGKPGPSGGVQGAMASDRAKGAASTAGSRRGGAGARPGPAMPLPVEAGAAVSGLGRLTAEILRYDERLRYSRDELLAARAAPGVAEQQQQQLLASLPVELARDGLW